MGFFDTPYKNFQSPNSNQKKVGKFRKIGHIVKTVLAIILQLEGIFLICKDFFFIK
jgi:hypothetical protein